MSGVLKVTQSITPCNPFTGETTGPTREFTSYVPAEVDYQPVPEGAVHEVLAWVEDSGERARAATMAELRRQGGPRLSLMKALQAI